MLSEGTRRALAAVLWEAGYEGPARLVADGTTDVYEFAADGPLLDDERAPQDGVGVLQEAAGRARETGVAQLVLVVPDGGEPWEAPELVGRVRVGEYVHKGRSVGPSTSHGRGTEVQVVSGVPGWPTPEEFEAARTGKGPALIVSALGDETTVERVTPDVLGSMRDATERGR